MYIVLDASITGEAELVVGAQLTNKTHFYCEKLNSYEHLQILWGYLPPVPPWFRRLWSIMLNTSKIAL